MREATFNPVGSQIGGGGQLGGQYTDKVYTDKVTGPPNFAATTANASKKVSGLVGRLGQLADRLCGPVPTDAGGGGPSAVPNGLLGEVMDAASTIGAHAEAGLEMIERIERALP